jgi:hypothetical protein
MTDIVERLRAEDADPREWRRMYGEAADEIEILRGALHLVSDPGSYGLGLSDLANIARATLKGTP